MKKKKEEEAPPSPVLDMLGGEKKSVKKPGKKHRHKRTIIDHHSNGSHTVRHSPDTPEEVSYAAPDLDGVHDGMEEHVGEPNHDEGGAV